MAAQNTALQKAKRDKNDEFYTCLEDIEAELIHYEDKFRGKTVFCNCDDPTRSNFWVYFHMNFERLGLRKLISTHYENGEIQTYKLVYEGGNDGDFTVGQKTILSQNGDFRSPECIELLKESDIVCTNPPFSLFREYVAQLMEYKKQFLILGNMNAITYKEFFPLLKDNKVWLGCSSGSKEYMTTEAYAKNNPSKVYQRGGKWYTKLGNTCWFTNLDHAKRHQMLPLDLGYTYYGHEDMYPRYDNYDAINVDKVSQIPCDYEPCWFKCPHADSCRYAQTEGTEDKALCEQACNGEMGVPISYLTKHSSDQMQIIANGGSYNGDGSIADELYIRHDSKKKRSSSGSLFAGCRKCNGVIGVPISFLDKYCPEQFRIVWQASGNTRASAPDNVLKYLQYQQHAEDRGGCTVVNNIRTYGRIFIQKV